MLSIPASRPITTTRSDSGRAAAGGRGADEQRRQENGARRPVSTRRAKDAATGNGQGVWRASASSVRSRVWVGARSKDEVERGGEQRHVVQLARSRARIAPAREADPGRLASNALDLSLQREPRGEVPSAPRRRASTGCDPRTPPRAPRRAGTAAARRPDRPPRRRTSTRARTGSAFRAGDRRGRRSSGRSRAPPRPARRRTVCSRCAKPLPRSTPSAIESKRPRALPLARESATSSSPGVNAAASASASRPIESVSMRVDRRLRRSRTGPRSSTRLPDHPSSPPMRRSSGNVSSIGPAPTCSA